MQFRHLLGQGLEHPKIKIMILTLRTIRKTREIRN
jgi:hypothetical protein